METPYNPYKMGAFYWYDHERFLEEELLKETRRDIGQLRAFRHGKRPARNWAMQLFLTLLYYFEKPRKIKEVRRSRRVIRFIKKIQGDLLRNDFASAIDGLTRYAPRPINWWDKFRVGMSRVPHWKERELIAREESRKVMLALREGLVRG